MARALALFTEFNMMLQPKQKGNLTELQCITAFYELGLKVSIPFGEDSRYDFIADIDDILYKIQCKTSKEYQDGAYIKFSCRSTRVNATGNISREYNSNEIDFFCTFYKGICYLVPVEECSTEKKMWFHTPKNNQKVGINYAKEYELVSQIKKVKG